MTQRTLYILTLTLGSLMLTLPLFGTSATSIETSLSKAPDTTILSPFDLSLENQGVLLMWKDINESFSSSGNELVDKYEVQHSTNAINFSVLATLDSDEFSHLHLSPINGLNYYRLKIIGVSGTVSFTDIIAAALNFPPGTISPSIVDTGATLSITSPIEEPGELKIYDMSGRLIYSQVIALQENSTLIGLDFTGWHTGHYVATISGEQLGNEVIRFVKR